ncbi:MAG: MerR family transcriptional regulator, partial [Acidimicrobiia bacterium]
MPYTVGEVSQRTGVTIRTLHHYDALGLLVPERTAADVRVYDDEDLERLAGILTWRALGVPLDRIGDLLDGGDEVTELSERRRAVRAHLARLER